MKPPDLPEHDPCGPSSLGRLMACPASWRLSANEPETLTDDAKEGTALHELMYGWRRYGQFPKTTTDEERELVHDCERFVEEKLAGRDILAEWAEERVELLEDDGQVINYGTADLVIVTADRVFVFDWKFGRLVHRHSLVLQLANYAVAAVQTLARPKWGHVVAIEAWAYFPRLSRSFLWQTDHISGVLKDVRDKVWNVIERAEDDSSPAVPGPWCDHCRHLARCKAVRALTTQALAVRPERLLEAPEKVAGIYDAGALAVKQFEALRARVREILTDSPEALPGLALVDVKGRRRVTDLDRLWRNLVESGLFSDEELGELVQRTIRPVALEEAFLSKEYKGRGEGPSKKALRGRLSAAAGDTIFQPTERRLRRTEDGRSTNEGAEADRASGPEAGGD